jgi:chromosome partitioning protein
MSKIVAIANQKGGVAKTTSALALGTALADRGPRVLLVDLDPQASLTIACGVDPDALETTLYDVFAHYLKEHEPADLGPLRRSLGPRLDLLPTSIDLAAAEMELLNAVRREYALGAVLRPVRSAYDLMLIDCPPSLSLLTLNALTAAHEVLIPLVPEFLAARGVGYLLGTIARVRKSELNPDLAITGILLTLVDNRTNHGREVAAAVRARLDGQVPILGEVKRTIKASEAAAEGVSLMHYAARSETARAYAEIADELARTWGLPSAPAAEVSHAL